MKPRLHFTPTYLAIIAANLFPVYWAITGRLIFFQVLYLYWIEGFVITLFNVIRILTARGIKMPPKGIAIRQDSDDDAKITGFGTRLKLAVFFTIARVLILFFYSIFIFAFIALMVSGKSHLMDIMLTVAFRNDYFNFSLLMFIISAILQLIGGFFVNGEYLRYSPRAYNSVFDGRTIVMHVMIVGAVFIHQFLFAGKSYEAAGEIVYIALFRLLKTVLELSAVSKSSKGTLAVA